MNLLENIYHYVFPVVLPKDNKKLVRINNNLILTKDELFYKFSKPITCRKSNKLIQKYVYGNIEACKILLISTPSLLFYQVNNKNILHFAIIKGDIDFILFLLEFAKTRLMPDLYNKWTKLYYPESNEYVFIHPPYYTRIPIYKYYYSYAFDLKTYNLDLIYILLKHIPLNDYVIYDLFAYKNKIDYYNYDKMFEIIKFIIDFINDHNKKPDSIKLKLPLDTEYPVVIFPLFLNPHNSCNIYEYDLTELLSLLVKNGLHFDSNCNYTCSYALGWLENLLYPIKKEEDILIFKQTYELYLLKNLTKIYYLYFLEELGTTDLMKYLQIEFKLLELKDELFRYYRTRNRENIMYNSPFSILTYSLYDKIPFLIFLKSDLVPYIFYNDFIIFNVIDFL